MKVNIIVLMLGAFALFTACHRKAAATVEQTNSAATTDRPSNNDKPASEPKPEVYQVVGFQKTGCFGKCPVFQVKIFSDGTATWYGQRNVERQGWYDGRVDKEVLKAIRDKANEVRYWDFSNEYPKGRKVADLPSTVTFFRSGDMVKTVVNTHEGPSELEAFEDYLEGIVNGLSWQARKEGN